MIQSKFETKEKTKIYIRKSLLFSKLYKGESENSVCNGKKTYTMKSVSFIII